MAGSTESSIVAGESVDQPGTISRMKCDICKDDNGEGIHYHAFIDGQHYWVCANCKSRLKIESDHTDE